MKRYYDGEKVCPGCKVSGREKQRHSATDLCSECAKYLRIGRTVKPEADIFARATWHPNGCYRLNMTHFTGDGDKEDFTATDPPAYISDRAFKEKEPGTSDDLAKAFIGLLQALDVGERDTKTRLHMLETSSWGETFYIPRPAAIAIFELYKTLRSYSVRCVQDGFNDGRNLISGLANGSLTIDKVNEQTTRVNERR